MPRRAKSVSSWVVLASLLLMVGLSPEAFGDKKNKGSHGHGRGNGHGHKSSGFHVGLGPAGVSYGYHSRGFSVQVNPSSGYGYGGYGYPSYRSNYYVSPSYYDSAPYGYQSDDYYQPNYDYPQQPAEYYEPAPAYNGPQDQPPNSTSPVFDNGRTTQASTGAVAPTPPRSIPQGDAGTSVVPTNPQAAEFQFGAEDAFRNGDYQEAARLANHAMLEDRENGKLLLFQSQIRFAVADYEGAVAFLDQAMEMLGPNERGFVVEHYHRLYKGQAYVEQMNRLIAHNKQHPKSKHALALRAYHYAHLGHEAAASDLINPKHNGSASDEQVGTQLIGVLRKRLEPPTPPTPNETTR